MWQWSFTAVSVVVHQQRLLANYAVFAVGTFGLSLSQRSHKPLPDLVIAPFVVLTKGVPVLGLYTSNESRNSAFTRLSLQLWHSVALLYQSQSSGVITSGFLATSSALITFPWYSVKVR